MSKQFIRAASIRTLDQDLPLTRAMLLDGCNIAAVGDEAEAIHSNEPDIPLLEYKEGQTILPAFSDAHIHLWKVGDLLTYMLDLRGVTDMKSMLVQLGEFARRNPSNPWILARGFNEALFPDKQMPTRSDLDKIVPDRPVQLIRTCAHIAVLNSRALEICGINAQTPVPKGGEIRLGADGEPNGILTETALGLSKSFIPAYTEAAYRRMITAAQDLLLSHGVLYACDPAVHPELLETYIKMDEEGLLKMQVNAMPIRIPDGASEALPLPEHYHSEHLTIDTVKFFADGGLSGMTAALKQPYKDSTTRGVLRLNAEYFFHCALEAQEAGYKIATHAIGDEAIDLVLNVYERLAAYNKKGLRHRIEHLGLPDATQLGRMKALGIHCVTQPAFLWELGPNFRNYLDEGYLNRVYPFRAVLESGVNLVFSSDAPVVKNLAPLMGLRNAVTRQDNSGAYIAAAEAITLDAAVAAYTRAAADLRGESSLAGTLSPGKRADFVVLDTDPWTFPASSLDQINVRELWRSGTKVFSAK